MEMSGSGNDQTADILKRQIVQSPRKKICV